jgi:hypothetical protein
VINIVVLIKNGSATADFGPGGPIRQKGRKIDGSWFSDEATWRYYGFEAGEIMVCHGMFENFAVDAYGLKSEA